MLIMLKDITLGQYFPGKSIIHRLDPRTKILLAVLYIVSLFVAKGVVSYVILAAVLITCICISRISMKAMFKGLKPLIVIIVITALLNMFYTDGKILVEFWIFKITLEGIFSAIKMVSRIVLLVSCTFLLTYTTSPIDLTDGLEKLLGPLKKIKMPIHEISMMMSIALRFIPTLIDETDKIMSAQKARGASFDTGNIIQRAKALLPILVPLFISAFRRADELAVAMESRCYHGDDGRTKMKQLRYKYYDGIGLLIGAVLLAGVIVLRQFGL